MSEPPDPPSQPGASRPDAIAEALRAQILEGKYGPGERLPSERDLAARIGANRASVREALKRLELEGLIAIRRGGGARVVPLEEAGLGVLQYLLDGKAEPDPALVGQWLDVQELVLAGGARFAVERATEQELREATLLLERLTDTSITDEEVIAVLDELTELLAVASRNIVLHMVRNGLTAQLQERHALRLRHRPSRRRLRKLVRELRQAIEVRDGSAAAEAVRALLRAQRSATLERVQKSQRRL